MPETTIEWASHVWNPFTGCDRVSPGCARCYALTAAGSLKRREQGRIDKAAAEDRPAPKVRYQRDGDPKTSGPGFGFTVHEDKLADPEHFPAGARVFVNSMSDVFHDGASDLDIARLFAAVAAQPWADFLILTKRPERMYELLSSQSFALQIELEQDATIEGLPWPLPNVWLGVSIENRRFVHRADLLRATPAAVRFISAEPLLGPLISDCPVCHGGGFCSHCDNSPGLDLAGIDWLIVGGESGPRHRPMRQEWALQLLDACGAPGGDPAFFFKQWGGRRAKEGGRELDGRTWGEIPEPRGAASV